MSDKITIDNFDEAFNSQLSLTQAPKWTPDPNQFRPSVAKAKEKGKAEYQAVLRFIPPVTGAPWVKKTFHYFQEGNGNSKRTFNETCRWHLGRDAVCPACDSNISDNKSGNDALKARAKGRNRRDKYLVNVLIINDSIVPENNGKIMWWEMPIFVYDQIEAKRNPTEVNAFGKKAAPINPWNPYKGLNFGLTMKDTGEQSKLYHASAWDDEITSIGTEEEVAAIRARCFDLQEILMNSIISEDDFRKKFLKTTVPGGTEKTFETLSTISGGDNTGIPASYTGTLQGKTVIPTTNVASVDAEFDKQFDASASKPAEAQKHETSIDDKWLES